MKDSNRNKELYKSFKGMCIKILVSTKSKALGKSIKKGGYPRLCLLQIRIRMNEMLIVISI